MITINEVPQAHHIPLGYKREWRSKYCFCVNVLKLNRNKARKWADRSIQIHIENDLGSTGLTAK